MIIYLKYFPTDRLLVHEWAHLRWGVFDEYNEDEPFYSAKSKKIEATRHVITSDYTFLFSLGLFLLNSNYPNEDNRCYITKQCISVLGVFL